jgi:hypothetical protein
MDVFQAEKMELLEIDVSDVTRVDSYTKLMVSSS